LQGADLRRLREEVNSLHDELDLQQPKGVSVGLFILTERVRMAHWEPTTNQGSNGTPNSNRTGTRGHYMRHQRTPRDTEPRLLWYPTKKKGVQLY
jgi:hypothetical protein